MMQGWKMLAQDRQGDSIQHARQGTYIWIMATSPCVSTGRSSWPSPLG